MAASVPGTGQRCPGLAARASLGWNDRVHSVELLVDDATDRAVRGQWAALLDAGLPSQGRHTGASNRPHVTLGLAAALDDPSRVIEAVAALPIEATLGGFVIFGRSRFVLARLVVPSPALLRLQAAVFAALADPVDPHGSFAEGGWTGHVTLAKRLSSGQVASALDALHGAHDLHGALVRARSWDIDARLEHPLGDVRGAARHRPDAADRPGAADRGVPR